MSRVQRRSATFDSMNHEARAPSSNTQSGNLTPEAPKPKPYTNPKPQSLKVFCTRLSWLRQPKSGKLNNAHGTLECLDAPERLLLEPPTSLETALLVWFSLSGLMWSDAAEIALPRCLHHPH